MAEGVREREGGAGEEVRGTMGTTVREHCLAVPQLAVDPIR